MRRVISLYLTGEFGKFILAGGTAAAVNFASRFVFEPYMHYAAAVAAAYGVGVVTAFTLNRIFVFPASGKPLHHEMSWFFLFNLIAFPVVIAASAGLAHLFGLVVAKPLAQAAAHAISIMLPAVANFAAHKFVTFKVRTEA
jgi:putative flippase GtrA